MTTFRERLLQERHDLVGPDDAENTEHYKLLLEKAYNLQEFGEIRRGFVVAANIKAKDNRRV